ncbi:MAG: ThiF family adenylyltransferase, partial [Bacteroidota bacterium]
KMLAGSELVIDAFDNSPSRGAVKTWCLAQNVPCLHVGMAGDYAEIIWNEIYRVPSPANDDVCDYPLARNLVGMTTAIGCEVAIGFAVTGARKSYTLTLGDFAVREFEAIVDV